MSRYRQSMREAMQEVVSENETFDEAMKWEVKITGLPTFYSDGKSRGQVRQALRKMLKRPDDIESIERTTPAALKKIRRDQAKGEGEDVKKEGWDDDSFDYKAKKGAIAAPGSGSIAKAKKAKASDFSKSIEQQMKDALKERFNADDVIRMIQFGHPFNVVDEDIPPELPGEEVPRYKNVSNAVVDKADKKSNKAMAKAEKDTLVPTQTKEQRNTWLEDSEWAQEKRKEKESSDRLLKIHQEREARYQRQKAQAKDKKDQDKDPVGKQHEALKFKVDVKGNPPMYVDGKSASGVRQRERKIVKRPKEITSITRVMPSEYKKTLRQAAAGKVNLTTPTEEVVNEWGDTSILSKQQARIAGRPDVERDALIKAVGKSPIQQALAKRQAAKKKVSEVAPPGWGHTKAEKEKTKPNKPKSKIGGSAHEFDKDLKSGKFKGLPGDTTYKDKKASMFKIMWAAHNKGDKPHYKPGVKDKLKSQYKEEVEETLDLKKIRAQRRAKAAGRMKDVEKVFNKKTKPTKDLKVPPRLDASDRGHFEEVEESKLPPHLSKFFDKKGDMKPDVAKRVAAGRKKREAAAKVTDVTPKGYGPNEEENLLDSAKRYLNEKADWNTAFKSAAQSRPPMRYKDAVSFIDTAGLNSTEKRSALKAAKKWLR